MVKCIVCKNHNLTISVWLCISNSDFRIFCDNRAGAGRPAGGIAGGIREDLCNFIRQALGRLNLLDIAEQVRAAGRRAESRALRAEQSASTKMLKRRLVSRYDRYYRRR